MSILNLEGVSTGTPLNSLIRPTPFLKRLKTNRQDAVFIAIVLAHQVGKQVAAYLNLNISDISQILLWTHLEKIFISNPVSLEIGEYSIANAIKFRWFPHCSAPRARDNS